MESKIWNGLIWRSAITLLVLVMVPGWGVRSLASQAQECPIQDTNQLKTDSIGGLFPSSSWVKSEGFSWDKALGRPQEIPGEPIERSIALDPVPLDQLEKAESYAQCVVQNRVALVEALKSYQWSTRVGRVIKEDQPESRSFPPRLKLRNRTTLADFECQSCQSLILSVTHSNGIEPDSIQASSVVIGMILDPADFSRRSFRTLISMNWLIRTTVKSASFVWDSRNQIIVDARELEVY